MPALADVAREKLRALEAAGQRRTLKETVREAGTEVIRGGKTLISFSCNDYLGLSHHPEVMKAGAAAIAHYGAGAGASRLVTGNHPLYAPFEAKLAKWKGAEAALVFGSGYLANTGIIPSLVSKGDLILADRLVHACIIDGAQLSGAKLLRFAHNDLADCAQLLEKQRANYTNCLIVTDEIFSMDGDVAPLEQLGQLARQHDAWLMADGAHSFHGSHPPVDIYVGTLSKALASYGGYVAASHEMVDYLAAQARSFIFTTGLPPAAIAAAQAALDIIMRDAGFAELPLVKARKFTEAAGLSKAQSAIVPLILGDEEKALAASKLLEEEGYLVAAIRPPTVPKGTSRLRFAFSALHSDEAILKLAGIVKREGWV